jgi:hypothetical protein
VFAEETATVGGGPPRSDGTWIFEPGLPRSTGLGPVLDPFFSPHAGSVKDRAGPVEQALATEFSQDGVVQFAPQPSCGPLGEAAVRGLERHLERGRKVPPRTSAGQHAHDRGEHRAGRQRRRTPTLRARLELRNQRLNQGPQLIRHQTATTNDQPQARSSLKRGRSPRRTRSKRVIQNVLLAKDLCGGSLRPGVPVNSRHCPPNH